MRIKNLLLIISVLSLMVFYDCRYTIIDKKAIYRHNSDEIYGCWEAKYLDLTDKDNPYIEFMTIWIDDDFNYKIHSEVSLGLGYQNIYTVSGKYRIKEDTLITSFDKFANSIDKYIYKIIKDTLVINLISREPNTDENNNNIIRQQRPLLENKWIRY